MPVPGLVECYSSKMHRSRRSMSDPTDLDLPEVVNAITDDFGMEEVKMDRDTLREYLISYCNETSERLPENERDGFEKAVPVFTDWIVKKAHLRFYTTINEMKNHSNPAVAFGYKDVGDTGETFVFIRSGLVSEVVKQ